MSEENRKILRSFMKNYLIDNKNENKRLNFQNTIDVYDLARELEFFNFNDIKLILDAGCGNGNVTEKLLEKGIAAIHAMDLSDERVQQTTERFSSHKNINVFKGALEKTGLKDSTYDGVIARYIFEHVVDPKLILMELNRILKPNAQLFIINFDDLFFNFHTKNELLNQQLRNLHESIPQDFKIGRKLPQMLKECNFDHVVWEAETFFFKGDRLALERENSRMRLEQGREHMSKYFNSLSDYDAFAKSYLSEMKDECNVLSMTKYLIKACKEDSKKVIKLRG
jgi:ubiquinone/menaquinone biosynthesis C-methylase UbiE